MPLTMIGVPSSLFSGRGPRLSVLKRHATSSLLKLLASIWSSGAYLLPRRSAVYIGQSPFLVLGIALDWPRSERRAAEKAAATTPAASTNRDTVLFMTLSWMAAGGVRFGRTAVRDYSRLRGRVLRHPADERARGDGGRA